MAHHERPDHRPRRSGEDARGRGCASELRTENARLERLLRTFSHDLKGQLMVASGHVELARAEPNPTDHLDAIERAHDRIEALIVDVSTLAADGSVVGEREPVDVERLVEDCWANVETAEATLVVDADSTVRADASRLSQVFENLFRNAVEHGSTNPGSQARQDAVEHGATSPDSQARQDAVEHGASDDPTATADADLTVTVGLLPKGRGLFVEDDGTGIPEERRDRAFEAGFSTSEGGTGLGLTIVRDVVEAHGWTVELTDGDDGARFEIAGLELRLPET